VFITELCAVLHEEISEVSRDVPLVSLGIDSMMSLELAHRLEQRLGIPVSPSRLLGSLTVSDIEAGLADGSILSPDTSPLNGSMSTPSLEEQSATQLLAHLEELSDDEVTRLLAGFFDEDGQEQRRL
jgi:phosphopantetheine attachment domain protein